MLKIAHIQNADLPEKEPKKLSKYKDPAYIEYQLRLVIREHNEKIRRAKQAK